jgi:hypothetical protein
MQSAVSGVRSLLCGGAALLLLATCDGRTQPTTGSASGADGTGVTAAAPADPLPSWRDGASKASILGFLAAVTDPSSSSYLAPAHRVAAFDNDGTLWVEKPFPPEQSFAFDRVRTLAGSHSEWRNTQPFQAILAGDQARLARMSHDEEVTLVGATHTGMTPPAFRALTRTWLDTWTNPRFGKHPGELVYQPMLELLAEVRRRGFAEYLCSGDTIEFLRAFAPEKYGIPEEHIVGTGLLTVVRDTPRPALELEPGIVPPYNTFTGKPVNVQRMIGRMPTIVVGNEDGDLPLLELSAASNGPRLLMLIHHDDAEREFAYDKGAERALRTAREHGWTVVSMKRDFATVFPPAPAR